MKKKYIILLLALVASINFTNASHLMGGEITWKCLGNGDFKFRMIVYRDCKGISFGPPVALDVLNCPATTSIPMNLISQTDISPISTCSTCLNPNGLDGSVEEFIFESDTVHLYGTPPTTGWKFIWYSCCRNAAIDNLSSAGGLGFTLRAIMYSVNNQPVGSTSNSSPQFDEKAVSAMGNHVPVHYVPLAHDDELDSLDYSFAQPFDSYFGVWPPPNCPYSPNYSVTVPLPGQVQNPLNQPVTLDPFTGDMNFLSHTTGNFVTVVRVAEYRCGQLISEIFREMQMAVTNQSAMDSLVIFNSPPEVMPPFVDASGLPTYSDTVFAGDFVNTMIEVNEYDTLEMYSQHFSVNAFGNQFGNNFTDSVAGCLVPPCATLNQVLPLDSQQLSTSINLNWQTTVDHLGLNYPCAYLSNTYTFLFATRDDYCPVHAFEYQRINITVLDTVPKPYVTNNGNQLFSPFFADRSYQWYKNRWPVIGATSNTFSPTSNGTYQLKVIDTLSGKGNYSEPLYINYTGLDEAIAKSLISVNPNPSKGRFNLSGIETRQPLTIVIRNLQGQIVYQRNYKSVKGELPIMINLMAGVYSIAVMSTDFYATEKLIIQ